MNFFEEGSKGSEEEKNLLPPENKLENRQNSYLWHQALQRHLKYQLYQLFYLTTYYII